MGGRCLIIMGKVGTKERGNVMMADAAKPLVGGQVSIGAFW